MQLIDLRFLHKQEHDRRMASFPYLGENFINKSYQGNETLDKAWEGLLGKDFVVEDISLPTAWCCRPSSRDVRVALKLSQTSLAEFKVRRKLVQMSGELGLRDHLMMSVGRLIVFDVTVSKSFEYAKIVLSLNNLNRPKDKVKYSPRIIVVGDMARTEEVGTERAIAYD